MIVQVINNNNPKHIFQLGGVLFEHLITAVKLKRVLIYLFLSTNC